MKRVLVIGLGSFGTALCETLHEAGAEVIAVDESAAAIDGVARITAHAVIGDGTDPKVLEAIEARTADAAVVTFAEHFEGSVLAVASLKKLGSIEQIVARASTPRQADVLAAVGATRVIQLESEGGRRLGRLLTSSAALDLMEFARGFTVVPWTAHGELVGRSLAQSAIRARYGIHVLGVQRRQARQTLTPARDLEAPTPDYVIARGDVLLLVGQDDAIRRFAADAGDDDA